MRIQGKTALVTGATGGLGEAIVKELAKRGATVIASSRKAAELDNLIGGLPGTGHRTIVRDLAEPGAAERLITDAGPIDILIANAALPASGSLADFTPEQLQRALRVNFEAPIIQTQTLLPALLEKGDGHIVYISSIAGRVASPGASLYNGTKFGLRGFALGLRQDLQGTGVGASIVLPGFVRNAGMFADSGASAPTGFGTATPEQVAAAVVVAIDTNRREIMVAPRRQRLIGSLAAHFPRLAEQTAETAKKVTSEIVVGQANKR